MIALLAVLALAAAASPLDDAAPAAREAVAETFALRNFHEVEPGLYRLAQPDRVGIRKLKRVYHVRTLVDLRFGAPGEELDEALRLGISVRVVPMNGLLYPSFASVDAAVALMSEPSLRPLAVHCRYGRDRTGVVVAAYEVVVKGFSPRAAAARAHFYGCCPATFLPEPLEDYLERYRAHAAKARAI